MSRLADFGSAQPQPLEPDTFGYYGQEIRVHYAASELAFLDFMEEFGDLDETDPRGAKGTKDLLRSFIHPDDFELFWTTAKAHRQGLEDILAVVKGILEALTGRPTGQPSGSSAGRPPTPGNSTGDSSSRVIARLTEAGRPDLALVAVQAAEARQARALRAV